MKKTRVALIFGGESAEHEVSIQSARNIIEALDKDKYEAIPICIDKKGNWHMLPTIQHVLENPYMQPLKLGPAHQTQVCMPVHQDSNTRFVEVSSGRNLQMADVVFPILHGPLGEDGTIQGMLKLTHIPFVGCGVLSSAVCMDKDFLKRILREASLPIAPFRTVMSHQIISFEELVEEFALPFFVKPANMGSSIGVHKVKSESDFENAMHDAFKHDRKVLIEKFILGREIEVAVLGNEVPTASLPGELKPTHEFYSYEAKYLDENGAHYSIPADLSPALTKEFQNLAVKSFQVLGCEGIARVDFFLDEHNKIYINELNTMPGFTRISMYPKMFEASGIPYSELIDRLIQLALEKGS